MVTPRNGTMFGCAKRFHSAAALRRVCRSRQRQNRKKWWCQRCTFPAARRSPPGSMRNDLMRTFESLWVASCVSPKVPEATGWPLAFGKR